MEVVVIPVFTAVQGPAPLFVDKNTPPPNTPAKTLLPLVTKHKEGTFVFVIPLLDVHEVPLLLVVNKPLPSVPAKTVDPLMINDKT